MPTVPNKPDTIEIRGMTRDDLPQVLVIEKASFPLPYSENLFHMELDLNSAHMMVAVSGDLVLGYLDFWHVDSELHVINIAVGLKARQQGIGSRLLHYLVTYGGEHSADRIYLDVRESNQAAVGLYEKFGFEQIDVRKGYYQDNEEDALVMQLKLK